MRFLKPRPDAHSSTKDRENRLHARECLMDPGLTPGESLFGTCPKMQSVSALGSRMFPDPALMIWIEAIRRGMPFG